MKDIRLAFVFIRSIGTIKLAVTPLGQGHALALVSALELLSPTGGPGVVSTGITVVLYQLLVVVVTSAQPAAYRKSPIGSSMDFRILKILEILLCRHATLFILIISATSTQLVQAEPLGKEFEILP